MAAKYSLNLTQKLNCKNKACKACGLYLNQLPVLDKEKKSNIFWVGLSAVMFDDGVERQPLSPTTRSGNLISQIETSCENNNSFYKTNLVKCVPLKNDKIRYPLEHEMEKCFPNFEFELDVLRPSVVFLLGKQVANFVFKKLELPEPALNDNYNYNSVRVNNILFVPVHHPSFILVYKRKNISDYIEGIQTFFSITTKVSKRRA